MRNLKIVFMGTPDFAVPSLKKIVENGFEVVGVVTAVDKPSGRGLKVSQSPVKEAALALQLKVLQPKNLKDPSFQQELKELGGNLFIVVAFRMLPEAVWSMPQFGTFNLHASYLPAYRGAAPINWAIINGEKKTGLTTFFLKHEIDTGSIILQREEPIFGDDTAGVLYERMKVNGADLVLDTVRLLQQEKEQIKDQEVGDYPSAPKIFREDCNINFNQPAEKVYNFIRGLSPYPAAWTILEGKQVKIFWAEIKENEEILRPGKWASDNKNYALIGTEDHPLSILELQLEGKKKLSIKEFLKGFSIP